MFKNKLFFVATTLLLTACAAPDAAQQDCRPLKDGVYRCNGNRILNGKQARTMLPHHVRVSFGAGGALIKGGMSVRETAKRSDAAAACRRAFLQAVKRLQNAAHRHGGSRVTNLHGAGAVLPSGWFDCETAGTRAAVEMRGDIAR